MGAEVARLFGFVAALAVAAGAVPAQQAGQPDGTQATPPWPYYLPKPADQSMPPFMSVPTLPPATPRPPIELRTLDDIFLALELCWQASLPALPVPGMTVRVALSFMRSGEMFGEPTFTFVTPGVPPRTRTVYQRAAAAALARCNPLPFSDGLGNATAGRPFLFQFIDRRTEKEI